MLPPRGAGGDRPRRGQPRGYAFQVELTYRAVQRGFRVVEVPIVFRDRRVGSSKMSRAIVAEAVWRVPLLRFDGGGRVGDDRRGSWTPSLYFLKY